MHIVADENIPLLEACFARFGSISRHPGRTIDRAALGDAEVLLVRSVTQVDRALLEGSRVRFVGTCTIGTDHMDLAYLKQAGIAWASAPGCNARGVVDYVLGSLLVLAEDEGLDLATRTYGIVGAGEVGGRLAAILCGLGWTVKVCDPPRQAAEGGDFVTLDEILASCDVISLHTPLTREGPWPTWHLLAAEQLAQLRLGSWLINASRGAVVDNPALCAALASRSDLRAVLDVWEGEPLADPHLVARCRLATPHIAGYSLDGKLRGTLQILQAYCAVLGEPAPTLPALPSPWLSELSLSHNADPTWALRTLCHAVYDPRRDDADFRRSLVGDDGQRRAAFDQLRKQYPMRRETDGLTVTLSQPAPALRTVVNALGARLRGG